MKNISLYGNQFKVPSSSYDFLQSYLGRMRTYMEKHGLEKSLYDDIEERISERFSQLVDSSKPITEKNVIDIVNEIGEPEDIFSELGKSDKKSGDSVKAIFQSKLYKNMDEAVIFGVCAGLGDYFEINAVWFRILFITSLFFFGSGIIVYIALAVILPKRKSHGSVPTRESGYEQNFNDTVERVETLAAEVKASGFWSSVERFIRWVFASIGKFIRFILLGGIGMVLIGIGITALIVGALVLSDFVVSGQILFANVPMYTGQFLALFGISSIILGILSIGGGFGRALVNGMVTLVVVALFATGVFGVLASGFQTATHYTQEYSINKMTTLDSFTGSTLVLDYENMSSGDMRIAQSFRFWVEKSADEKVHVETISRIRARDTQTGNKILSVLRDVSVTNVGDNLTIATPDDGDFTENVPFSFLEREVVVYLPANIDLNTSKLAYRYIDGILAQGRHGMFSEGSCINGVVRYNPILLGFICTSPSSPRITVEDVEAGNMSIASSTGTTFTGGTSTGSTASGVSSSGATSGGTTSSGATSTGSTTPTE